MKILVLSDSHCYMKNAMAVLERIGDRIDVVFHMGDCVEDAVAIGEKYPDKRVFFVRGNNDYASEVPYEKLVCLGGKKFLLTHGHRQRVDFNSDGLFYLGQEKEADVVVFGHTHIPYKEYAGGLLLFNPGSISLPRAMNLPTFGVLDISAKGEIEPSLMSYSMGEIKRLKF